MALRRRTLLFLVAAGLVGVSPGANVAMNWFIGAPRIQGPPTSTAVLGVGGYPNQLSTMVNILAENHSYR